jgi:CelD/BcsL family acetyltransferase involved in cellulose biosynthesis
MRIYTLEREGKAVACDYVLQRGETVYFYQTAFDPDPAWEQYHPGYTLLAHCIEDSVHRGAREFDFLRGREEYKERWTDSVRETWLLTVVPNEHVPALTRYRGGQALRWTKQRLKALLSRGKP